MGTVLTIASIPAILALVQLAKTFGVTGKWNTLLAVALGVILQLGDAAFLSGASTPAQWYAAFGAGLILGLSAAGLYDAASVASTTTRVTVSPDAHALLAASGVGVPTVPQATASDPEPGPGAATRRAPGEDGADTGTGTEA